MKQLSVGVIGGGYYGCYAAIKLAQLYPDCTFTIIEKEARLFSGASSTNQGQLHKGYMYALYPELLKECHDYSLVFESEFADAINQETVTYYGIHQNSAVSPEQFEAICKRAGLPLQEGALTLGPKIKKSYRTAEKTINNNVLQQMLTKQLSQAGVKVLLNTEVASINDGDGEVNVVMSDGQKLVFQKVINASFASINTIHETSRLPLLPLTNDRLVHFRVKLPEQYKNTAVVIGIGPFGSLMPAENGDGHLLDMSDLHPSESADYNEHEMRSAYNAALPKVIEWLPFLKSAEYRDVIIGYRTRFHDLGTNSSTAQVKVLTNFGDIPGYTVLLGGKISCLAECMPELKESFE